MVSYRVSPSIKICPETTQKSHQGVSSADLTGQYCRNRAGCPRKGETQNKFLSIVSPFAVSLNFLVGELEGSKSRETLEARVCFSPAVFK